MTFTLPLALKRIAILERALQPFAAEADEWWHKISDRYHPGVSEPRSRWVNPGSKTVFSLGDCRRAKRILNGGSR